MIQDIYRICVWKFNFKPVIYSFTFTQKYMRNTIILGEQEVFLNGVRQNAS